jgi:hypothetical protein
VTDERKENHHHADRHGLRRRPQPHQLVRVLGGEGPAAAERVKASPENDRRRDEGYGNEKKNEFVHLEFLKGKMSACNAREVATDRVTGMRRDGDGWQVVVD